MKRLHDAGIGSIFHTYAFFTDKQSRYVTPGGTVPSLLEGENQIEFSCDSPTGPSPRARVTIISHGDPL